MRPIAWTIGAGMALGTLYLLSPATVWFAIVIALLFFWIGRGLSPRERRWLWAAFGLAVALRVVAVAVLFLMTDHHHAVSFFWDGDGLFLKRRSVWILNTILGVPMPPQYFNDAFSRGYGWSDYIKILSFLQYWWGPAPYGVHLFNVATYLSTTVLLFRRVRASFGRESGVLAFVVLLFLPTPFAWSVSALKESVFVFLCATGIVALMAVARERWLVRLGAFVILLGSLATIEGIRVGGRVIEAGGLMLGLLGRFVIPRFWLVVLLLVTVPLGGALALRRVAIQDRVMAQLKRSALIHIGNVKTEGHGYRLLDDRFYAEFTSNEAINTLTPLEAARFTVRALVAYVILPVPWDIQSRSEMLFLTQQVIWYVMVLLVPFGFTAGLRRDMLLTCLLSGLVLIGAATVALNSGNVGTMVRHRDMMVPFVVSLSSFGAISVVSRLVAWWDRRSPALSQSVTTPWPTAIDNS